MKRVGNIFQQICSIDNLNLADSRARKRKRNKKAIQQHDKNRDANILAIQNELLNKTYQTPAYTTFKVFEPKERDVYCLPYKDRIVHHAIMNVLEPVFVPMFTADTYSCIKGRGIHSALYKLKKALKNVSATNYCLKLDIRKFYPSIDHDILKSILRRKFKDNELLWLLDEIIDSADGLPIGNYISQYFSNLFLTYFDHWLKEVKQVKYYYRYADDIVILGNDKQTLRNLLYDIADYFQANLNLVIKHNYQIFPVASRGIDFLGYRFFHTHIELRKSIKQRFARKMAKRADKQVVASYMGWAKHCNSKHLLKKLLPNATDHYQIQRPERTAYSRQQPSGWRQDQNRPNSEQGNYSTPLRNKALAVP